MKFTRKIVCLSTGIAACAVVAAGILSCWDDVLISYHRHVLADQPGRIPQYAAAPADSLRGKALRLFAGTPRGKDDVLRAMIACSEKADGSVLDSLRHMSRAPGSQWLLLWSTDSTFSRELCAIGGASGGEGPIDGDLAAELRGIQAVLEATGYERHTLPEYPGFLFTVHHRDRPDSGPKRYAIQWNDWPDGLVLVAWRPVEEPEPAPEPTPADALHGPIPPYRRPPD